MQKMYKIAMLSNAFGDSCPDSYMERVSSQEMPNLYSEEKWHLANLYEEGVEN